MVKLSSYFRWKKRSKNESKVEIFLKKYGSLAPKRYTYAEVQKMTSFFSEKLGQGGYGSVYKGKIDESCKVAVKVLIGSKSGNKDFFNEVISIGCTFHINIVTLLGFCVEGSKRMLIYEFVSNGSLDRFIYSKSDMDQALDTQKILQIAIGIAKGLEYLHHGCNVGILHLDIKPHNILLDENFCPKIADFGLAKLCHSTERMIKMLGARGTIGYIAPEIIFSKFGGVSSKSDVYSYGMMVLEMVGGRKNFEAYVDHTSAVYFPHWAHKHLDTCRDLRSVRVISKDEEELVRRMILISLWCIQTNPLDRPSMRKVLDLLEGRVLDIRTPPMPILSSPARSQGQTEEHSSFKFILNVV